MTAPHPLEPRKAQPRSQSGAWPFEQRIVVRDMLFDCRIGVSEQERAKTQRLRLNLEIELDAERPKFDDVSEIVDYGVIARRVRELCSGTDVRLLETLAGQIADSCFLDERIGQVRVRLEKLDRYDDIDGIGVEIAFRPNGR